MRRPTVADQLGPFEVFAGRELSIGRPLVARLIGRRFDTLLDDAGYEKPYDPRFGKAMVKTLSYLCATLGASFGYVERTELSLYAVSGGGDARRLLSRIAGEAAAKLSLLVGQVLTFEARLYEFPDHDLALEYFRWRQEDAHVHAIDRYCTHVLGLSGADATAVPRILDGLGPDEKVELLRQNALEFATVPAWQRLGAVVRVRPAEGSNGAVTQGRLLVDLNLPGEDEFGDYLKRALQQ
ncbi:MAG TPA: tRNA(His) guanylyltransferase Thg1 family protein [Polyangia bacterium]|nr:tRNA(His) guanylyltransferase Thg1 family protein [Polyangia bacterium]